MIVKNEKLLKSMRESGLCEWCGVWCERREPHHIHARGMGGGSRLDIPINLVSLGTAGDCSCHAGAQRGNPPKDILLAIAAEREIRALMRAPKECKP